MSTRMHAFRNLLTALTFTALIAAPVMLHVAQEGPADAGLENRRLSPAPMLADLQADWVGFPEQANAWMRDHFGLRRSYLQLGFRVDRLLSATAGLKAVRGDDGWLFNALNGALAQHRGLLPFSAGEADAWLDGLEQLQARAQSSGAVFVAVIPPNKHTVYPEKLTGYPRRVSGETRLEEVQRRAKARGLPLIDLRQALVEAKTRDKVYYQTDTHWTDLGAYQGFLRIRAALAGLGVTVPEIPREALILTEKTDFSGDIYGLLGEESGAAETVYKAKVISDLPGQKAGSILIIGDSFTGQLRKYFNATFDTVTVVDNAAGAPELGHIVPGEFDVVLFQIVERYLSRPLAPVAPD